MSYPNDIYVYLTDTVGSGLPFLTPGDLPNPGIKPGSPALQADFLPPEPLGKNRRIFSNIKLSCQNTLVHRIDSSGIQFRRINVISN